MPLELETYATQRARWPHDGKVIRAVRAGVRGSAGVGATPTSRKKDPPS
jgi:hypothetical protein